MYIHLIYSDLSCLGQSEFSGLLACGEGEYYRDEYSCYQVKSTLYPGTAAVIYSSTVEVCSTKKINACCRIYEYPVCHQITALYYVIALMIYELQSRVWLKGCIVDDYSTHSYIIM